MFRISTICPGITGWGMRMVPTSNWIKSLGYTRDISVMNSSMNSSYSASEARLWRRPKYSGSSRKVWLLVPRSRMIGSVEEGRMLKCHQSKKYSRCFEGIVTQHRQYKVTVCQSRWAFHSIQGRPDQGYGNL